MPPNDDLDELMEAAKGLDYPLFVKAVAGGGGRGMRKVDEEKDLKDAIDTCMREAEGAFGDPTVFIEQAVVDPRHIEVQILADAEGNVIHLFERDCSVQRRHQKVVEIAPAPNLDPDLRERMCADAVRFATEIGYRNAGTVEFLLGADGDYHFIEMNPRIQVEHTVTEEVTDVDLVQSQLRIAAGETLADLGLDQDTIRLRGAALQCRITTEDPTNGFRPDTGRITTYRSPGGGGVRLDGGTTYTGAEVSAHFDSMLAKLTCRGRTFEIAVQKARRAVDEFRIRGVATNIPFLRALLDEPDFLAGRLNTSFIEDHPGLLTARPTADRGTRLLTWLAEVTVNKPHGERPVSVDPATKLPDIDLDVPAPDGSRQDLLSLGPEGLRARPARADAGRGHRHHLPRRPPVAAGHPGAHPRPAHGRRSRLADDARAAQRRGMGRCDVRRGAAVPPRGPVGPARQAAPGRAEHLPADAAARSQHGRLHAVPDRGHATPSCRRPPRPASTSSASSTPSTTSSRCARRSRPCGRPGPPSPRSRSATPAT